MSRKQTVSNVSPEIVSQPAPAPTPLLYDISTSAKILSTTTFAVRELCRTGKLKHIAIGHRWLISLEAIRKFIRDAERAA